MTDFRARCAELAQQLDGALDFTVSSDTRRHMKALISTVRAELAEAGPAGPSDKELLAEAAKALGCLSTPPWEFDLAPMSADDLLTVQRAAIAADRVRRQQIQVPALVGEMPWQRKDWCHPQERWAWFYNRRVGWRDAIPPESLEPPTLFPYTHSLPFNALPLP